MMTPWYQIKNPDKVPSPALLVFPERVKNNILEMVRVAGGPGRLRPHVKTHKCREIVSLQQDVGIVKFKCATIAEAEMLAECNVQDILLAYQPTGPNLNRYLELIKKYQRVNFSALVDNPVTAEKLCRLAAESGEILQLFIDLDIGMHRTGVEPGPEALDLMHTIKMSNYLKFRGWHVYDGHIQFKDFQERKQAVQASFEPVTELISTQDSCEIVAGGSPTFPVHALNQQVNLSPGTCLLWDQRSSQMLPDQKFLHAAVLMTRVVSKPMGELLCLDLGHKAVASEMPHPRVHFADLDQVEYLTHSEEHLVIRTPNAMNIELGDVLFGIPTHICPTTALHQELVVVEGGEVVDLWKVFARDRRINV